ncbi:unnamed protein product [Phytophthora fragariaefolia]|uniref:RxLR effector protein n=1 Tax=Phytophthora fragariaefolia TaxID=1490495 RepID=A0A9W7D3R4_9STRA|nr:unnamed protein product [Phytophthora fragariaefolia]
MRLLLWLLLVTLVTFISSASAISAIANSDEAPVSQLTDADIDVLSRVATAGNDYNINRFLRVDAKKDLTADDDSENLSANNEERGIFSLVQSIKNGWSKWKANALEKAFQHMMKKGETPTSLAKRLKIGEVAEPRFEKLYEKYTAWWINFHTNAGT